MDSLLHIMLTFCLLPGVVLAASIPFDFNVSYNDDILQGATSTASNAADDLSTLSLTKSTQNFIANVTGSNSSEPGGNSNFPPASFIGFGLDMTSTMLFDLESTKQHILTAWCFFDYDINRAEKKALPGSNTEFWMVPDVMGWNTDGGQYGDNYATFKNGSATKEALRTGGSASGRYEVVTGGASVDVGIQTMFNDQFSYALFEAREQSLEVRILNYGKLINDESMENQIASLPPFNKSDKFSLRSYRSLFETSGTHIITEVSYGARLSLCVWAENKDSTVVESFEADVNAAFNGLTSSGEVEAHIRAEKQYQTFSHSMAKTCTCSGGNSTLAASIGTNPAGEHVWEQFLEWKSSVDQNPSVTGFTTQPLWNLVKSSNNSRYNHMWTDIQDAYEYIASHPATHLTNCRIIVNARTGGIDLLSPEAFIAPDPGHPVPKGVTLSGTKIYYEADPDILPLDLPTDVTIDFIIKNYSPTVDFGLYHSEEGPPEVEHAGISINILQPGNVYANNDASVDVKQFIRIPVNPNAIDELPGQDESAPVSPTGTQSVSGQNASLPENFTTPNIVGPNSSPLVGTS